MVRDFFKKEELEPVLKGLERLVDIQAERLYKAGKIKGTSCDATSQFFMPVTVAWLNSLSMFSWPLTVISETGYPDIAQH